MNIIVTNKYKDLIYNSNIEILKDLHGVFKVSQIVNAFNSIFYKKIIIDATALDGFPKDTVLKELVSSFEKDKLILFLPPDNPPPKKFLSFLVSINLYNFTDNPNGLIQLTKKSNTINDVSMFVEKEEVVMNTQGQDENQDIYDNSSVKKRIILGLKSITGKSFSTEIIYSMMKLLEEKYQKKVLALEIDKRNFLFYNNQNMNSLDKTRIDSFLQSNSDVDIILVDLGKDANLNICDDIICLVNPSLYEINKLMFTSRDAFLKLKGEKVMFVNSLLTDADVNQFAKEANISIYYNLSPINDRIVNNNIEKLLAKLGFIENTESSKPTKKGLFDIFK